MRSIRTASPLGLALALLPALAAAQETEFQDVSAVAGVEFNHDDGVFSYGMGGGAAWFDIENDGDLDLFATSSDSRHALYRFNGTKFVNKVHGSGIKIVPESDNIGVIAADYNQDGFTDLYLTNAGPNQLYRNNGNGTFTDVAVELGLASEAWTTSASWADFDLDGDLDLYLGNYLKVLQFPYHVGEPNQLFINEGTSQEPMFVERAVELGVDNATVFGPTVPGFYWDSPEGEPTAGCTLSVCTLDFDEDGDADLMVGNDFGLFVTPNIFYRNDTVKGGELVFTDISAETGLDDPPHYNMGINPADYDHDGDWDFYLSNLGDNSLKQNVDGIYIDVASTAGPLDGQNDDETLLLTSWGTVFGDFDNDGWEDLLVVNGVIPAAEFILNEPRSENHLWMNQKDGTFERLDPEASGMNDPAAARGVADADVNGDGHIDVYVMNNGAGGIGYPDDRCRLYVNNGTLGDPNNTWVQLRLKGQLSNLEGIGTRLDAFVGDQVLKRQLLADPIFISSRSRVVHFGLGPTPELTRLEVHWPSGVYQEIHRVPVRKTYDLVEPRATIAGVPAPTYVGETLVLEADVTNEAREGTRSLTQFQLRHAGGGPVIWSAAAPANLAFGETETVAVGATIPAAIHRELVGTELEARILLTTDGVSWDMRSIEFALP